MSFRFSAIVFPVTVRQSPWISPSSSRYFKTAGIPPILWISSIRYLPLGFKSARNGVLLLMLLMSSIVKGMLAVLAMAKKCSTALVEPPNMVTKVMAFSKDFLVIISDGFMSFFNRFITASPAL